MKKTFVIAMLLVLALTASTFAASFADVPANHWAYEAVNKLVAAGIIKGYPDGTYGGQRTLTRYEIAVIVARVLEDIEAQRDVLAAKVDKAADSLSKGEAKDVTAIVMALLEKNKPEVPEVELPEGLTEQQAEEVVQLIKALTFEFKPELEDLGAQLDVLAEDLDALDARVAALEAAPGPSVSFSGTYGVTYEEFITDGTGTLWLDPYNEDFDGDEDKDDDDKFTGENKLQQDLDLSVAISKGALSADLEIGAYADTFDNSADSDTLFTVESLSGTITGNDFVANIGNGQAPGFKPYLLNDSTNDDGDYNYPVNGVVVDAMGNRYAIVTTEPASEEDSVYILAGNDSFELLGLPVNVVFGTESLAEGTKVVGFDTTLDLGGFEVTPELALNEAGLKDSKYFTLKATGNLAAIETEFNYALIEGFTPIQGVADPKKGFDVTGTMAVGPVDVTGYYGSYEVGSSFNAETEMDFTGTISEENALDLGGFAVTADGQYRTFSDIVDPVDDPATRKAFNVSATNTFGKLTVTDTFNFADETQGYYNLVKPVEQSDNDDYTAPAQTKKNTLDLDYAVSEALTVGAAFENDLNADLLTTTLDANYEGDKLTATAELVKAGSADFTHLYTAGYTVSEALSIGAEMANTDVEAGANWRNKFTAEYAQGILAADFTKYLNDADNTDDMIINGSVTPDAVVLAGFNVAPYAEAGYKVSADNYKNYAVGVNADKALSEAATFTAKYEYADKEFGVNNAGTAKTTELGLDYSITEDLTANFSYVNLDFDADVAADSYEVKKASVGVELAF